MSGVPVAPGQAGVVIPFGPLDIVGTAAGAGIGAFGPLGVDDDDVGALPEQAAGNDDVIVISWGNPVDAYEVVGAARSGLSIRPGIQSDLVAVARAAIRRELSLPNRRLVLEAYDRPVAFTPVLEGGLRALAEEFGTTIALKYRAVNAERLIVIQQLLDAVGIPHMPMESGPLALMLAREGVVVQRCMPEGAKMLCGFTYGHEDMYTAVDRVLGREAREGLVVLVSKLDAVRNDTQLRDQSAVRGFSVSTQRGFAVLLDQDIGQSTPIDVHGGDSFANVAWHPSIGWFLFDW